MTACHFRLLPDPTPCRHSPLHGLNVGKLSLAVALKECRTAKFWTVQHS
jgi:hypothetical protein